MTQSIRDVVLDRVMEEDVFARYLGISIDDVNYCLSSSNNRINNPLRNDNNPSLTFKRYSHRIIMIDYANNYWRGDIFEIVGKLLNLDCTNAEDFNYICRDILHGCINSIHSKDSSNIIHVDTHSVDIDFIPRDLTSYDYALFYKYGLKRSTIDKHIMSAEYIIIDDEPLKYRYTQSDPNYIYTVNPNKYKIYFPTRHKSNVRFMNNNKCPIENLDKIKANDNLIITKAIKDKLLIEQILRELNVNTVSVITVSSETAKLTTSLTSFIKSKYKEIYVLFDNDATGIESMQYYQYHYSFTPIYFNLLFTNTKDPSDAVKIYGYKQVVNHLNNIIIEKKWK